MNEFENDFAIAKCIRMRNVQSNSKESDGCIGTKIALDEKWNIEKKTCDAGATFYNDQQKRGDGYQTRFI